MLKKVIGSLYLFSMFVYAQTGVVKSVVDGDTVKFKDGNTCRFAYIDTPESASNSRLIDKINLCNKFLPVEKSAMLESGNLAKAFLKEKIKEDDILTYEVISIDRYSRQVCNLYNKDSENINLLLIKEGFAVPYNKYIKDASIKQNYNIEYLKAKNARKGIHSKYANAMECLKSTN